MPDTLHIAFVTPRWFPTSRRAGWPTSPPRCRRRWCGWATGDRVPAALRADLVPPGEFAGSVHVPVDEVHRSAGYYVTRRDDGVEVVFIEHPPFFDRPTPYGEANRDYPDNPLRLRSSAAPPWSTSAAGGCGPASSVPTTGRRACCPCT